MSKFLQIDTNSKRRLRGIVQSSVCGIFNPESEQSPKFNFISEMKILQSVQKYFSHLGISSEQSKQTKRPINARIAMVNLMFVTYIILNCVYLFHVAGNFKEYTQSIYMTISAISNFSFHTVLVRQMKEWFRLIDGIEKSINRSEFFFWRIKLEILFLYGFGYALFMQNGRFREI